MGRMGYEGMPRTVARASLLEQTILAVTRIGAIFSCSRYSVGLRKMRLQLKLKCRRPLSPHARHVPSFGIRVPTSRSHDYYLLRRLDCLWQRAVFKTDIEMGRNHL